MTTVWEEVWKVRGCKNVGNTRVSANLNKEWFPKLESFQMDFGSPRQKRIRKTGIQDRRDGGRPKTEATRQKQSKKREASTASKGKTHRQRTRDKDEDREIDKKAGPPTTEDKAPLAFDTCISHHITLHHIASNWISSHYIT